MGIRTRVRIAASGVVAGVAFGACFAARPGELVGDPWPRVAPAWEIVPRPERIERRGAALVARRDGFFFEAVRLGEGAVRLRVVRGEPDERPSFAVLPDRRPLLDGNDAELEAALFECVRNLQLSEGSWWRWFHALEDDESILGLGQRPPPLQLRGRRAVVWSSEAERYDDDALRLSQAIPFWIAVKDGRARGFLVDDTYKLGFDFGVERPNLVEVTAEGGDFAVHFLEGPTLADVLERYTALTGRPTRPPVWALGVHHWLPGRVAWDQALAAARSLRDARIPGDVLCGDFAEAALEPDAPEAIAALGELGFEVVCVIGPGVALGRADAAKLPESFRVRAESGGTFVGEARGVDSVFPDVTLGGGRAAWAEIVRPIVEAGVAGLACEGNEPALTDGPDRTMPGRNQHAGWGEGTHFRFHNVYGQLLARSARELLERVRGADRSFVQSSAGWAGIQRFAASPAGEGDGGWREMRRSVPMTLGLGMSGQPFVAADVARARTSRGRSDPGGASAELFVRWSEVASLLPLMRTALPPEDALDEPWIGALRRTHARRARLLPLLTTLSREAERTGAPIARPLPWIWPADPRAFRADDQFLLGDHLLVAPVVERGATEREVYLPEGTWFPYDPLEPDRSEPPIRGPRRVSVEAPPGRIPMFARAGAVIPVVAAARRAAEADRATLELDVFEGEGALTLAEEGASGEERTPLSMTTKDGLRLTSGPREGSSTPPARTVTVRFHDAQGTRAATFLDDGSARETRPPSGTIAGP